MITLGRLLKRFFVCENKFGSDEINSFSLSIYFLHIFLISFLKHIILGILLILIVFLASLVNLIHESIPRKGEERSIYSL